MTSAAIVGLLPRTKHWGLHPLAKPLVFVLALLPLASLVWAVVFDQLGANPAQALVRATGDWSLRMLCVVLAVTPLRVLTGSPALARFRRMLGLFVYFYVLLHLLSYSGFDMGFEVADIAKDIAKRPFILVGFSAFVLLTGLALTSFNRAIKALGGKNWQRLHRVVYLVAGLAILHFYWMRAAKNDFADVLVYAAVLLLLLGWRALRFINK
ncbi:MAG: sulfoxide reductase heme-binding subunit YedZ [Rhodoferax sp.]|nr:sulfoxide reductase heme-binding subunit YedZ [Betaproteobacteria bacterium]NCN96773.1 sulfoxide reductase heme-binding subunit YedZ [Rhodoferax sp.]OIP14913.1 MAG: sulfoxide reductase heme-binding subunit YedZ [Comamonadaceae bacterium CG2_30_57_122]PIZ22050.1 MAG: sulfoxide reductase heme-binding subunit YedZ [Comamonadaceae bacterium CG_4_10_14_0_8_um_filter_57_29]PJC20089.1 MAG: sulfoxide reductase heme-binding subunit YedZ [Comamonadaceae bacterium CG_4_9_14_0_8_um_filter_57_21]